jgi:thioredoxin 1
MATEITDNNFEEEVLKSTTPVLVDFWAEWCGPCKMLSPVIDEISKEMAAKLKVVKINIDTSPNVPSKLGIRGIPTMILFKDGEQVATKVGALPKASITEWVNSIL